MASPAHMATCCHDLGSLDLDTYSPRLLFDSSFRHLYSSASFRLFSPTPTTLSFFPTLLSDFLGQLFPPCPRLAMIATFSWCKVSVTLLRVKPKAIQSQLPLKIQTLKQLFLLFLLFIVHHLHLMCHVSCSHQTSVSLNAMNPLLAKCNHNRHHHHHLCCCCRHRRCYRTGQFMFQAEETINLENSNRPSSYDSNH